jgi:hypothetical protein
MDELETIKKEHEGDVLNWYDVKKIVKNEWH